MIGIASGGDAALLTLGRQWEAAFNRYMERVCTLEDRIAAVPARSYEGAIVKLRVASAHGRDFNEARDGEFRMPERGAAPIAPAQMPDRCAVIGWLRLRPDTHRAYWRGGLVKLTLSEFAIVHYMAIQLSGDVTYRQIYDVVHGKDFVAGSGSDGFRANVRSFIKRIRRKFRDVDPDFNRIENYPRFGYRWRDGRAPIPGQLDFMERLAGEGSHDVSA